MNVRGCQGIRLGPCPVPFSFRNIHFDLVPILPIGQWQTPGRLFSVHVATHRATTHSIVVGDILFVTPDVMVALLVAQCLLKNMLVIFLAAGTCSEIGGPEICWVQNHLQPGSPSADLAQVKTLTSRTGERGGGDRRPWERGLAPCCQHNGCRSLGHTCRARLLSNQPWP